MNNNIQYIHFSFCSKLSQRRQDERDKNLLSGWRVVSGRNVKGQNVSCFMTYNILENTSDAARQKDQKMKASRFFSFLEMKK